MGHKTRLPNERSLEYIRRRFITYDDSVMRDDGYMGTFDKGGYFKFKVPDFSDKEYPYYTIYAHHICWYLEKGEWPREEIDHIDHNIRNNSIENLQILEGRGNAAKKIRNSWLPRGVKIGKKGGYEVYITWKGKQRYCGYRGSAYEAGRLYEELRAALYKGEQIS